jgi:hypothetical protein
MVMAQQLISSATTMLHHWTVNLANPLYWDRKVRIAVLTFITYLALC